MSSSSSTSHSFTKQVGEFSFFIRPVRAGDLVELLLTMCFIHPINHVVPCFGNGSLQPECGIV